MKNQRTARQLSFWAGDPRLLCVDLGAGLGAVTKACLRRDGPVLAIESDPRLAAELRRRYADEPRVTVVERDLTRAAVPSDPFVIAANPPFNQSTAIVRHWFTDPHFVGCAMIVEKRFAQRVSGHFGATKLSLSLAPYFAITTATNLSKAMFHPQPKVPVSIMTASRLEAGPIPWSERLAYGQFLNYLFERGSRTVGASLAPIVGGSLPRRRAETEVRDLSPSAASDLWRELNSPDINPAQTFARFDDSLPPEKRSLYADSALRAVRPSADDKAPAAVPKGGT